MISKIPKFLQQLFSKSVEFRIKTKEKVIFLTFDDGPDRTNTPKILDILKKYNAKATFFMLESNMRNYTPYTANNDK